MAKAKRPSNNTGRLEMDYYEFKRQHDMKRLKEQALQKTADVESRYEPAPVRREADAAPEPDAQRKSRPALSAKFLGGMRKAVNSVKDRLPTEEYDEDEALEPVDDEALEPEDVQPQASEKAAPAAAPEPARVQPIEDEAPAKPAPREAPEDAPGKADDSAQDAPRLEGIQSDGQSVLEKADEDEEDEPLSRSRGDVEITNPFAGTITSLIKFGAQAKRVTQSMKEKIAAQRSAARDRRASRLAQQEEDQPEPDFEPSSLSDPDAPAAPTPPSLTLALSEQSDQGVSRRRRKAAAEPAIANDDPLGVIEPASPDEAIFRRPPEAEQVRPEVSPSADAADALPTRSSDPAPAVAPAGASEDMPAFDGRKGLTMSEKDKLVVPELTEKLAEELDGVPALSRRERKAMAAAAKSASEPAQARATREEPAQQQRDLVDEPTQQFRPLRARTVSRPVLNAENDGEEDEDDDIEPARKRFARPVPHKKRVYRDEEVEPDDDEDYEDEYDEDDYDEDDYDEEDYDEEDERYHVSFGKRLLSFIKGLLILVIVLMLIVVALRQLESSGVISLNIVRSTVGQIVPLDALLPEPQTADDAAADDNLEALPTVLPSSEPVETSPAVDDGVSADMTGTTDTSGVTDTADTAGAMDAADAGGMDDTTDAAGTGDTAGSTDAAGTDGSV